MRDRVVELLKLKPRQLRAHPRNWRQHSEAQRAAWQALRDEVGFAGAILARRAGKGYEILDGHLRVEEAAADDELPVLVVDLTDAEAELVLATHDPLGGAATVDAERARELLGRLKVEHPAIRKLLATVQVRAHLRKLGDGSEPEVVPCPRCKGTGEVALVPMETPPASGPSGRKRAKARA